LKREVTKPLLKILILELQRNVPSFPVNSTPVDCEEGSNQTSLRNTTPSYIKESKGRKSLNLLKNLKISRIGTPTKKSYKKSAIISS